LTKPKIGTPARWVDPMASFTFVACTGVKTIASDRVASACTTSADCRAGSSGVSGT
jgi:hypothetical protein